MATFAEQRAAIEEAERRRLPPEHCGDGRCILPTGCSGYMTHRREGTKPCRMAYKQWRTYVAQIRSKSKS